MFKVTKVQVFIQNLKFRCVLSNSSSPLLTRSHASTILWRFPWSRSFSECTIPNPENKIVQLFDCTKSHTISQYYFASTLLSICIQPMMIGLCNIVNCGKRQPPPQQKETKTKKEKMLAISYTAGWCTTLWLLSRLSRTHWYLNHFIKPRETDRHIFTLNMYSYVYVCVRIHVLWSLL